MTSILDEASFENQMRGMTDRQLSEFTARQIFDLCKICATHTVQITQLQGRDKKAFGAVGGIAAFVGTAIGAFFLYLYQKLTGS